MFDGRHQSPSEDEYRRVMGMFRQLWAPFMPDRRIRYIRLVVSAVLLGSGLLLPLLWLWVIRHGVLLQWAIAVSLCGVGSGIGIYGMRATEQDVKRLRKLGPPEPRLMFGQQDSTREWRELTSNRRLHEWGLVIGWTVGGVLILGPLTYLLSAERAGHELLFRAADSGYALSAIVVFVVGSRAMDRLLKRRKEQQSKCTRAQPSAAPSP